MSRLRQVETGHTDAVFSAFLRPMAVFKMALQSGKDNHVVSQSDHCAETREKASTSKGRDRGGNPGTSQLKVAPCDAHWHGGAFERHLRASGPELKIATLGKSVAFQ